MAWAAKRLRYARGRVPHRRRYLGLGKEERVGEVGAAQIGAAQIRAQQVCFA
jgi:hypothetical protein